MEIKSIFKSKIFWTQIIASLLAILELVNPGLLVSLGVPQGSQVMVLAIIGFVTAALTIIFRKLSTATIKVLIVGFMVAGLSGCAFVKDAKSKTSFEIVKRPTDVNDTVSLVGKFWGFGDLVSKHVPPNSKVGAFWVEANKYCTLDLISFPTTSINDTVEVQLTCHSSQKLIKGFTDRFKK